MNNICQDFSPVKFDKELHTFAKIERLHEDYTV